MKISTSVSKSKRALRLFTVFTGSLACLSFSAGSLQQQSQLRAPSDSLSFSKDYCRDPVLAILWDSALDCYANQYSWREKYPSLNFSFYSSNLSRFSRIDLIYQDPLFLDLNSSEMEEFATIVEGGGFSRRIQRESLEDRKYGSYDRAFGSLARRMLLWIVRKFGHYGPLKTALTALDQLTDLFSDIKEALKEVLVEYLGFSYWWADWVVRLASFVFIWTIG